MLAHPLSDTTVTVFRGVAPVLAVLMLAGLPACGGGGGGGVAAPAPVTISIGQAEGIGSSPISKVVFPVNLSGPANGAVTVNYATTDQSAVGAANCLGAGDYVSVPAGTLTIASGASSGSIEVTVCHPAAFAGAAALKVTLTGASANGVLSTTAKAAYGLVSSLATGKLNGTGMAQCSNGSIMTACPQAAYPGQDATTGLGANAWTNADSDGRKGFAFAKVGDAKAVLSGSTTTAAGWKCVQDNVTGLLWETKTDANKTTVLNGADAITYVATVNAASLCGYSDWRLPTPQELASLVDNSVAFGVASTAVIDQTFFSDQQKGAYWSVQSADATGTTNNLWAVDFNQYGLLVKDVNTVAHYVRLVRGATAAPIFAAPSSETVADQTTGLTWRQCADGLSGATCATGTAATYTWQTALNRVAAVNQTGFAGHTDWRLPNRNELASIIDYSRNNPAIDTTKFVGFPLPGGVAPNFWTSTPFVGDATKAWTLGFKDGEHAPTDMTALRYLLLVRGGQ